LYLEGISSNVYDVQRDIVRRDAAYIVRGGRSPFGTLINDFQFFCRLEKSVFRSTRTISVWDENLPSGPQRAFKVER